MFNLFYNYSSHETKCYIIIVIIILNTIILITILIAAIIIIIIKYVGINQMILFWGLYNNLYRNFSALYNILLYRSQYLIVYKSQYLIV